MGKYAQLKGFHHNFRLQVYIHSFRYVDPEIISVEDYFLATKKFFGNYNKMLTPGPSTKKWLGYSYIQSEDYELYINLYQTESGKNQITHPTIKLNFLRKYCGH